MRSHSNREEFVDQEALLACPYDFAEEAYLWADGSGSQQWLYLTHRLDAPTSGVLVCATSL